MERSPQRCGFYPAAPLHWDLLHGPGQALEDVSSAARHVLAAWGVDAPSVFEVKGADGDATFVGLLGVVRERVAQEVADPQEGALPDAWFEGREAREEDKARAQLAWLRGLP